MEAEQMTVPEGYWTVFDKCSNLLILVECDLKIAVNKFDLLDGSVGIHWSRYRQNQTWAGEKKKYRHIFPDHRGEKEAWTYLVQELPYFDQWTRATYIPLHLPAYLNGKYQLPMPAKQLLARAVRPRQMDCPN